MSDEHPGLPAPEEESQDALKFPEEVVLQIPEEVLRHWETIDEIQGQSDRGAAIIAAAYLEDRLESVILGKLSATGLILAYHQQSVRDRLLSGTGPLQTFSAKIDFAAAVGFLGPHAYRDAHQIRKIRNDFAHTSAPASFGDASMVSRCANLWIPQNLLAVGRAEPPTDAREQYLDAVVTIWNLLYTEQINAEWEIGSPYCTP